MIRNRWEQIEGQVLKSKDVEKNAFHHHHINIAVIKIIWTRHIVYFWAVQSLVSVIMASSAAAVIM